ncbi:RNA-binding protein 28 [Corythoichthys intestinalis]|uniref:RNA-binding protein 28 n=1 Tax=Corythoichthys intestinalis TaxID=161448 RepID=UPI0025A6889F|nr:RNA-binding protein 28 [Corythoichthys intestinalis]XP_061812436.1 RNA-binding protein 28-like [Nerophis lumbriciformis]
MPAQTLFVGSLPTSATNERLEEIFSEIGPVKQCFVVRDKGADTCRGFGYVTYAMEEDAQRALKDVKEYDGKKLSISVAKKKLNEKKDKKKTATKEPNAPAAAPAAPLPAKETEQKCKNIRKNLLKARLIIRNLSFKCSEKDLTEVFGKCGEVLEAKIPLKPDGKMRGFAFVQFKNLSGAAKALQAMNMKEIKGRKVAVDWAVPKDKYLAMKGTSTTETTASEDTVIEQTEPQADVKEEETQAVVTKVSPKKPAPPKSDSLSDEGEDDDDDDDDDDNNEEESEDEEEDENDDFSEEEENDEDSLDSAEDEDDDDEDDEDHEDESAKKKSKKRPALPSDVKEGRTIFIRNLSFDTEEEDLEKALLQFGELNYIKIVFHSDTGHSKGCAFAQFKSKEAADSCIGAAQDEAEAGGIRLDGRKLMIVPALSKDDVAKLKVKKVKVQTGTRNLYLAREGMIRPGSKAAEGVPEADMIRRARFEDIKRVKLRDINVFVSKNRLCVHNLPKSVDAKKLRSLCFQGLGGVKNVRMTECRIMYDRKPEKGQVMGQSLGYGFVQFQEHEHALATLRYLNNNPEVFGAHKRPIVEFSLEDSRKLKIKEMRRQKSKEQNSKKQGGSVTPKTHKDWKPKQAPPHAEPRTKQHSGFQTKPEVEHVDLENGKKRRKVLPFPSHRGAKIRLRDKGKQKAPPPKKAQRGGSRKERQKRHLEKPTQSRNKTKAPTRNPRKRNGDRFDSLVEQYKKKLLSGTQKSAAGRKNKWFDN